MINVVYIFFTIYTYFYFRRFFQDTYSSFIITQSVIWEDTFIVEIKERTANTIVIKLQRKHSFTILKANFKF